MPVVEASTILTKLAKNHSTSSRRISILVPQAEQIKEINVQDGGNGPFPPFTLRFFGPHGQCVVTSICYALAARR